MTYPILQSYFSELFRTYNKVTTGFFVFMFEVAIGYFFIKSHRSKNEIFSFACLFSLLFFVIAALILAPIKKIPLIPRYMFPAYGLCLLFFAIEFESIERVKVLKTVCTILIAFCFLTFPEFYRSEAQEAREFNKFFNYMAEKDSPDDIFIRTNQDNISGWHHTNIINYFYPNRVFANTGTGLLGLEREVITYDDLFNNSKYTNRGAWIIIPGESVMDDSELESSVEFCGVYSVSHNTLTLYHAKRASDAKNLISLVDKSVNR
ncbi:hypothetical protein AGMMS49940_06120 [Spirochaetia bacterium]|nr:hypothetical protein AGMMS49940_06120 [Spirochaetia bacterium]